MTPDPEVPAPHAAASVPSAARVASRRVGNALLAAVCGLTYLAASHRVAVLDGLTQDEVRIGDMPASVVLPAAPPRPPVVIVQHGFSASRQGMSWIARGLARNGFAVIAGDFHGHGQNPAPFGLRDDLDGDLDALVAYARNRPDIDGSRIALVGHSMGAFAVYAYAARHPEIDAVVPISGASGGGDMQLPHNVLLIDAAGDPAQIRRSSRAAMRHLTGRADVTLGSTEGDFAASTARRFVEVPGHDHVTILFSEVPVREIVDWLRQTWKMPPATFQPMPPRVWLAGLLAVGAGLLLFFPVAPWLAVVLPRARREAGAQVPGAVWMVLGSGLVAGLALLAGTPLFFVPLVGGRELAAFLFLCGAAYAGAVWLRGGRLADTTWGECFRGVLLGGAAFAVIYAAWGTAVSQLFFNLMLSPRRAVWFGVLAFLYLPLGIGLEAALRGTGGWRALLRSSLAKILLLAALALGIFLGTLPPLIGLMLPSLGVVLLIAEAVAARLYAVSGSPVASGVLTALLLAWIPAAIFPIGA